MTLCPYCATATTAVFNDGQAHYSAGNEYKMANYDLPLMASYNPICGILDGRFYGPISSKSARQRNRLALPE